MSFKRRNKRSDRPIIRNKDAINNKNITLLTIFLASIALALYFGPMNHEFMLAHGETLGPMVFERSKEILLPDGVPNIHEMRDFMRNITQRADYNKPLDRHEESDITRSEAASIAFELARENEIPAMILCDKYYRLFASDKHLTLGGVRELMHDARHFDEIEQPDANLAAHILAEANYDSMKRLVTLHNVLLDEGIGVVSTIDLKVQKNLLQCIKYYKERHERALDGLSDYLWTKRDEIPEYSGNLDKLMVQFRYYMEQISALEHEIDSKLDDESEGLTRVKLTNEWLNRMAKMHRILEMASPMIPGSVTRFMGQERRKEDFERVMSLMGQFDRHKRRVIELEQEKSRLADYREALLQLYEFAKPHQPWLQEEFSFITEPRRDAFILGHIFKLENDNVELPVPKQFLNPKLEAAVKARIMQKAEISFEQSKMQQVIDLSQLPVLEKLDEKAPNLLPKPDQADLEPIGTLSTGWAERTFSVKEDDEFPVEIFLDQYDTSFYVKEDFAEKYDESEVIEIAKKAILEIIDDLDKRCIIEKARQSKPKSSCEKYYALERERKANDQVVAYK